MGQALGVEAWKTVRQAPAVENDAGAFTRGDPVQRAGRRGGDQGRGKEGGSEAGAFGPHAPTLAGADSRMNHAAGMLRTTAPMRNQAGVMGFPLAWMALARTNWVAPPNTEMAKA